MCSYPIFNPEVVSGGLPQNNITDLYPNLFMVRKHTCLLFLCLIGLITTSGLKAQDLDSLLNISAFTEESELQKILNKNLAVSAQKLTLRETPGIISIITAEEILNSGARDLIDILRLVPGFDVMQDLQFVMGLSLRGSWANEGKVLVMMDGIPFNELLYQSVAVGNRFPVDAIERIEIIRGPGSAMYGGSAEYGVINIISKAAKGINGVSVYTTAGLHADAIGRTNGGIMAGQKTAIFSWDISMFKGKGIVSDQPYQDIFQVAVPQALAEVTHADPVNVNVGLQYKSFSLRTLYDDYKTSDPFSTISFRNYALDMRYAISASSRLQITPRLQYFNQVPWKYDYADTPGADFNVRRWMQIIM
jgi:outer membrane cobalamin receptor